jgi:uncharacterized protein with FMN-binding domain
MKKIFFITTLGVIAIIIIGIRSQGTSAPQAFTNARTYKDGTYTGDNVSNPYGNVQVSVTVSGGKITDIQFPSLPSDNQHSQSVSDYASPILKQEAIQAQSANVNSVSGATYTSESFQQSLQSALSQA